MKTSTINAAIAFVTTAAVAAVLAGASATPAKARGAYVAPISTTGMQMPTPIQVSQSVIPQNIYNAAAEAQATGRIVLPERTPVHLRLMQDLKSGATKEGDEVDFELAQDLYGAGHVLVAPEGTPAYGHVIESKKHGIFGRGGKLNFTCDYIYAPDHSHIPLRSDSNARSGKSETGGMLAVTALVSVYGVFMNGRDCMVKKGTEFDMMVAQDTPIIATPVAAPPMSATMGSATMYQPGYAPLPNTPQAQMIPTAGVQMIPTGAPQAATSAAPAQPAADLSLFTLKSGAQVAGKLVSFDGHTYTVQTLGGSTKTVAASKVKSIQTIPSN